MKKYSETDYLYGSSRIRALENRMVGREKLAALMEARSVGEVMARMAEFGLTGADERGDASREGETCDREEMLSGLLRGAYQEVESVAPEADVFSWYRYPYDCNNLKLALKCRIRGIGKDELRDMLFDFGRVPPDGVMAAVSQRRYDAFPPAMASAVSAAEEAFAKTNDPQQIDALLDRACYADMTAAAQQTGEPVLIGWLQAKVDLINIMICVRILRMRRGDVGRMFLRDTLLPGGELPDSFFTEAYDRGEDALWESLVSTPYAALAKAVQGVDMRSLGAVEKCADDAYMAIVRDGARVSFGAPVLAGYLVGWETAVKNIRLVLAGREAGLSTQEIRERVRVSYV